MTDEQIVNHAGDPQSEGATVKKTIRVSIEDFLLLSVLFTLLAIYANWAWVTGDKEMAAYIPPFKPGFNRMEQSHLGAEYLNVATAIAQGRGFSDPFGDPTGPTGWVPPILPGMMAGVLYLNGGSTDWLAALFLGMQVLILAFTGAVCLNVARRLKCVSLALVAMAIVIIPNFRSLFQNTHDCVFQMFWVNIILLGLWYFREPPGTLAGKIGWGVIGGICALAGPATGLTWAIATTIIWGRRHWRATAVVAVTSIIVVAPWIGYQSVRLGKFTPIKSNAAFELYQGQVVLPNGLVEQTSFGLHPFRPDSDEGRRYREIGEAAYLAEKKSEGRKAVRSNPLLYFDKLTNRAMAATVWLHSVKETDGQEPWFKYLRFLALLPFCGLIALAFSAKPVDARWVAPAVCCYFVYLAPYVLVSYYERYGVPVSLIKMLFTLWLLVIVKQRLFVPMWNRFAAVTGSYFKRLSEARQSRRISHARALSGNGRSVAASDSKQVQRLEAEIEKLNETVAEHRLVIEKLQELVDRLDEISRRQ